MKEKTILIGVCCIEDSKMSSHMRERGGGAIRSGLPKHDMTKSKTLEALKQIVEELKEEGFKPVLWIPVPRNPWCTWQRVNLKAIEGLKEDLDAQRAESLAMMEGITGLLGKVKVESYFEWPKRNDGWKKKEVQEMMM